MSKLEFKDIEYVCAIIENKSFTKAAQSLFITQPTLSQYIKNMHRRIGVTLFKMEGKNIILTDEGRLFYERGRHFLQERDTLINELNNLAKSGRGILKLALPLGRGSHILTEILPDFQKKFPLAEVHLTEGSSQELVDYVENGLCDLVIINEPSFPLHIDYEILGYEKMLLVISKKSHWAKFVKYNKNNKPIVDLQDIAEAAFILHKNWQHSGQLERIILKNAKIKPHIILETQNLEASYRLAVCDYGVTLLSEYHINRLMKNDESYNCIVDDPISNMGIIIGYKSKENLSYLAREFLILAKTKMSSIN